MKDYYHMKVIALLGVIGLVFASQSVCYAQCLTKVSRSTNKTEYYQVVQLVDKKEYLSLSRTGEEKIFTYHNEEVELIFHVQMFTEIRFTTKSGTFSLFTTTSDRNFWNKSFMLSSPVTPQELEKMKGTSKIEIILPEERKIYTFSPKSNQILNKALACVL
ncbi:MULTISPECIES: hypothetical protein [Dyadobacter]|uniref:Uncharacterized protein n=1 Tax=Dyadobacter chenhuakuii TaxID=2909339 RepID=A0A9X1TS25_9BACT|nr:MULTISPECIES: hypothetical protein [Dyadobacter]MCF2494488.1 hypothetical protein [Dyadobacter chenhuakuii]MCF2497605.1 hypothetical protein [Dyadobacter chenhuakuii]MCF2519783.1 hypothetical protein [Dyadobacter sp. CY351]USJ32188.1 hypothetical protein NFI80_05460 [Dyadobacter chenhuakuii]